LVQGIASSALYWLADEVGSQTPSQLRPGDLSLRYTSCHILSSTILGGRDAIEEFVAAQIWPLSDGWKTLDVVFLDVDWASQKVPFP
jgi:hypothetical protein